jgi:hypothetical protein
MAITEIRDGSLVIGLALLVGALGKASCDDE